jgi:putative ABC transport system ATP-binding protein
MEPGTRLKDVPARLFDIRDLTKVYSMGEVKVHALRHISLTLDEGQFVVLLGSSGSGKSTLLNIVGGLDVPTSGQVFYRDTELTRADEAALTAYRRRHVALVTEISDAPMAPGDALRVAGLGPCSWDYATTARRRR